jgi:hypothetical protein
MPVLALSPSLVERWKRRGWAIALVPVLFALLTSTDLASFFAATWVIAPEVMAVVALPLLLLLVVRHLGRASIGSLQLTLVARVGRYRPKIATAAGLTSLAALVAGSIDLGALGALMTALGSVGDLGIWLWVLAAGIPEIAIIAAALIAVVLLVRTIFRFTVRLVRGGGDTR